MTIYKKIIISLLVTSLFNNQLYSILEISLLLGATAISAYCTTKIILNKKYHNQLFKLTKNEYLKLKKHFQYNKISQDEYFNIVSCIKEINKKIYANDFLQEKNYTQDFIIYLEKNNRLAVLNPEQNKMVLFKNQHNAIKINKDYKNSTIIVYDDDGCNFKIKYYLATLNKKNNSIIFLSKQAKNQPNNNSLLESSSEENLIEFNEENKEYINTYNQPLYQNIITFKNEQIESIKNFKNNSTLKIKLESKMTAELLNIRNATQKQIGSKKISFPSFKLKMNKSYNFTEL